MTDFEYNSSWIILKKASYLLFLYVFKTKFTINIIQMIELNRRLDSVMAIESRYQTIEKEMLILFPEIESVYFKTIGQVTPSVLVKCATQLKINSIDTSKISEWIRYRLDKDSIALTFVQ